MSRPEHVLVTGGAGFVGSTLADRLTEAGIRVSVIDDLSRGFRDWLPAGSTLFEADIRDRESVRSALLEAQPDAVCHLAALHFIPAVDDAPALARAVNVDGTRNVLEAASSAGVRRVVFASTAAVYPDSPVAIAEDLEPAPIDVYGETKLEGERLVAEFVRSGDGSAVNARLFNVIGPRETNPHVLPEIVEQVRRGATKVELGNLEPRRDFVDVRDVADALFRLIVRDGSGVGTYNVGTGRSVSVLEIVQECEQLLDRSIAIEQRAERMRTVERMVLLADPSALQQEVGWEPKRTFRETLSDLIFA